MRYEFNKAELEMRGMYKHTGTWYGFPYPEIEKLSPPIAPKENLRRYYAGEPYEWIPDFVSDSIDITPECNLDILASGFQGGLDAFGVKWIPVENNSELPAFVEPGFVLLKDITEWENLQWPDVDAWDWKTYADKFNVVYRDDDRMKRGVLCSGYFERLIALMTFEEAAVSLITDPESVAAFFHKLTEMNKKIIDHYIDDFGCEAIKLHDDWSAQKGPFFSEKTARELLLPEIKAIAKHCHDRGVIFTHHSCGNGIPLLSVYKDSTANAWNAQQSAFNLDDAIRQAGDDIMLEVSVELPAGLREDALVEAVKSMFMRYCKEHRTILKISDPEPDRMKESRRAIYIAGRELATICK